MKSFESQGGVGVGVVRGIQGFLGDKTACAENKGVETSEQCSRTIGALGEDG